MGQSVCTYRREPSVKRITEIFNKRSLHEGKEGNVSFRLCPFTLGNANNGCISKSPSQPSVERLSVKHLRKKRRRDFTQQQLKSIWNLYYPDRKVITKTEFRYMVKDIVKCSQEMWKIEMIDRVTHRPGNIKVQCEKYHITLTSEGSHRYWYSGQWANTSDHGILTEKTFLMDVDQASQKIFTKFISQIQSPPTGDIEFQTFIELFPKAFNMAVIRREYLTLRDEGVCIQFEEIDLPPKPGDDEDLAIA